MAEKPSSSSETYDDREDGMRQILGPPGEYPRLSQFVPNEPLHHVITPGYKPYKEACKRARYAGLGMTNEEKTKGTFDPATFVVNVWQKSQLYRETGRLWGIYLDEVKEKRGDEWVEPIEEIRESVRKVA